MAVYRSPESKERIKIRQAEYRAEQKDKLVMYRKEYNSTPEQKDKAKARYAREREARLRINQERKQQIVDYLGGVCTRCGEMPHLSAMEAHHTDPTTKSFTPSRIRSGSWEKQRDELDKCILLCANCHRIVHAEGLT